MSVSKTEKAAALSLGVNAILVLVKFALGALSGSVALLADAWHSLSDVAVSTLVIGGAWINRKQWRAAAVIENLIAAGISFLILSASFFLASKSFAPQPDSGVSNIPIVLVGAVLCALAARLIGLYKIKVGTEEDSLSLRADGSHSLMDFYTTVVVIIGLFGQMVGIRLDHIAALVVVLFVAKVGLEIGWAAIKGLARHQTFLHPSHELPSAKAIARVNKVASKVTQKLFGCDVRETITGLVPRIFAVKGRLAIGFGVLLVGLIFVAGLYTVAPHQVAMVTVFGKAIAEPRGPGIHFAPIAPVGKVYKVDSTLIRRIEIGFRNQYNSDKPAPAYRSAYEWDSLHRSGVYLKQNEEAVMLSGDENLIDINAVIHYRVSDPHAYAFGVANLDSLIRSFTESVLRSIVQSTPIDSLLTGSRRAIETKAIALLQEKLNRAGAGVGIVSVVMQDIHPPVEVVSAFREVASAKEDMALEINQAIAQRNQQIPEARAKALASTVFADGYRESKVSRATGEARRFTSLSTQASKARDITEFRLYMESMEKTMQGKRKFIVSPTMAPGTLDLRIFTKKK